MLPPKQLPDPWLSFLSELDDLLPESVRLHCIGGFVVRFFYGLMRMTGDIDYYASVPRWINLDEIAGRGSLLEKKYKIYLQRVGVTNLPEDYEARLTEMFPGQFEKLHLFAPDPYDLILSKIERNSAKDREDATCLFQGLNLDTKILAERYDKELRAYLGNEKRETETLKLWIAIFQENASKAEQEKT